jgi:hypothetical protein
VIDTTLFPYENFLYRLSFKDKKNGTICWFKDEIDAKKHITRYKLKPKDIIIQNGKKD